MSKRPAPPQVVAPYEISAEAQSQPWSGDRQSGGSCTFFEQPPRNAATSSHEKAALALSDDDQPEATHTFPRRPPARSQGKVPKTATSPG